MVIAYNSHKVGAKTLHVPGESQPIPWLRGTDFTHNMGNNPLKSVAPKLSIDGIKHLASMFSAIHGLSHYRGANSDETRKAHTTSLPNNLTRGATLV